MEFNVSLIEQAGGLLAPLSPDTRAYTVAGTHTTQAIKATLHETKGVVTPDPANESERKTYLSIWDEKGHISKAKVFAKNPAMQQACESLPYTIVRWEVHEAFIADAKSGRGEGVLVPE